MTTNGPQSDNAFPPKSPVVGIPISMTSYDEVLSTVAARPSDSALVVSVCNVHSVMSARRDERLGSVIANSEIATPDGVPLVWALRWTARPEQERVYGPELMRRALVDEAGHGLNHFLYGSSDETLAALTAAISDFAPTAKLVGQISPPYRDVTAKERAEHLEAIRSSGADVVWVGLGMPKQELWMGEVRDELPGVALVGVGAAFDFLAGNVKQAPRWMQRSGLEWLYRLIQEPRRLWKRYIWNNPAFVVLLARQVVVARIRGRGKR